MTRKCSESTRSRGHETRSTLPVALRTKAKPCTRLIRQRATSASAAIACGTNESPLTWKRAKRRHHEAVPLEQTPISRSVPTATRGRRSTMPPLGAYATCTSCEETFAIFTTFGPARDCRGHRHQTIRSAQQCANRDMRRRRKIGLYSDRIVYVWHAANPAARRGG